MGNILMDKNVYIINCEGKIASTYISELYHFVKEETGMECQKYGFVFNDTNGKMRSRQGGAKNIEQNLSKYLTYDNYSSFIKLETYDVTQDKKYSYYCNHTCGFYIEQTARDMFMVYIVGTSKYSSRR